MSSVCAGGRDPLTLTGTSIEQFSFSFPRDLKLHTLWDFFPPAFQCPHLVERVGSPGVGGKWVCGLDRLVSKRDCVIYSFGASSTPILSYRPALLTIWFSNERTGSSWEASFEAALLKRTKHCKFYGHHFDSKTVCTTLFPRFHPQRTSSLHRF